MAHVLVTGDDIQRDVQLTKGNAPFVIDPGATVQAAMVSSVGSVVGPVTVLEADGGDWTTSLVTVKFPSATSASFTRGSATLEIEVNDNGRLTWFVPNIVIKDDHI